MLSDGIESSKDFVHSSTPNLCAHGVDEGLLRCGVVAIANLPRGNPGFNGSTKSRIARK